MNWWQLFEGWLDDLLANLSPRPTYNKDVTPLSMNAPETPLNVPQSVVPPNPDALLPWTTTANCRHNVRALADLEGLTVEHKNLMSQVIHCESGYNIHAKHDNGTSVDHGICQWNSYFHASEITPDEAENNPEKAVRLMCKYVKQGLIKQWVCYSRGYYKSFTP